MPVISLTNLKGGSGKTTTALGKFWALSPDERREMWGKPIDPMEAVSEFDPKYLHDGHLGAILGS